jgi:cation transport ATPase
MSRILQSCLCFLLLTTSAQAQWISAKLNIVGLTCSACSFGTERSLRQLKFVQDVKMDLNSNLAEITFKPGEEVSLEQLVQKVYNAGYSVGKTKAIYNFTDEKPEGKTWTKGSDTYVSLSSLPAELKGQVEMTFVGEKFMPKKEYKTWKSQIASDAAGVKEGKKGKRYYVVF